LKKFHTNHVDRLLCFHVAFCASVQQKLIWLFVSPVHLFATVLTNAFVQPNLMAQKAYCNYSSPLHLQTSHFPSYCSASIKTLILEQ